MASMAIGSPLPDCRFFRQFRRLGYGGDQLFFSHGRAAGNAKPLGHLRQIGFCVIFQVGHRNQLQALQNDRLANCQRSDPGIASTKGLSV